MKVEFISVKQVRFLSDCWCGVFQKPYVCPQCLRFLLSLHFHRHPWCFLCIPPLSGLWSWPGGGLAAGGTTGLHGHSGHWVCHTYAYWKLLYIKQMQEKWGRVTSAWELGRGRDFDDMRAMYWRKTWNSHLSLESMCWLFSPPDVHYDKKINCWCVKQFCWLQTPIMCSIWKRFPNSINVILTLFLKWLPILPDCQTLQDV